MVYLTENQIDAALQRIKPGLQKYCWIQDRISICDVSRDLEFQTRFNGFYRVRRNGHWRNHYFMLMQEAKIKERSFPDVLYALKERTGMLEASFSSKLIATLDPDKPVVDRYVLSHFGLRLPYQFERDREQKIVQVYNQLCLNYAKLLAMPVAKVICTKFDQIYPSVNISSLKKIDLVLWQVRDYTISLS